MFQINSKINRSTVSFTPSFYKSAYNSYEQGYHKDIIAMMQKAAIDSQAAGCLLGRRAGFQRDFALTPFDEDNQKDQDNTAWLLNILNELDLRYFFKSIHQAILYKYSVIDFDWEIDSNKQTPVKVKMHDQRFFRHDTKDNNILKIDFGNSLKPIPEDALVCESNENPVMLPVLRDYILKNFGLESWASFLETFGEGIIIGKYPPGASTEIKDEIKTAVEAIAGSSRGTMPDNATIEVIESKRTSGDHGLFVEASDKGISISILGHANATQQSKGMQVGENLTSFKVKREIAVDDMYFIDQYVNKFIRNVWDRNFGDARYPMFTFDKSEPVNVPEFLEVVESCYGMGVEIDPSDIRKLGIKVSADQEPLKKMNGLP